MIKRALAALEQAAELGEDVIVVTHGGVMSSVAWEGNLTTKHMSVSERMCGSSREKLRRIPTRNRSLWGECPRVNHSAACRPDNYVLCRIVVY